ncbi:MULTISPECIES: amino acid transporter [Microbacterium]|jgi:hypothetical protein|uniref:amino acid transporter n=1 Tax=Microbacterium TaxID=33882 RepID=UPI001E52023C|nr:amino acid transporter [Microbacterium nymphoidis]MCD2499916.1 amino acid transporter [Microbacterium nymphoidis]
MTDDQPTTRKDLMRPAQMLGLAAVCAVFAGVVTAVSMGLLQNPTKPGWSDARRAEVHQEIVTHAAIGGLIAAGIAFIVVLLSISLLLLAVKPADVTRTIDRPVLYDSKPGEAPAASATDGPTAAPGRDDKHHG